MAIATGKVLARRLAIEVDGREHYLPKECDPIIGRQLQRAVGHEVEVLMARDTILAFRAKDPEKEIEIPITVCYYVAAEIAFDESILPKINPVITRALVESGYLDQQTERQLEEFQAGR